MQDRTQYQKQYHIDHYVVAMLARLEEFRCQYHVVQIKHNHLEQGRHTRHQIVHDI